MTFGEVITELVDNQISVGHFVGGNCILPNAGRIVCIQKPAIYGPEDEGEQEYDYIMHIPSQDMYIKTTVRRDSYGEEISYPYGYGKQVYLVQKLVTVYE